MGIPVHELEALAQRLLDEAADIDQEHARWTDLDDHEHDWLEHAPEQVLQLIVENRLLRERQAPARDK